MGKTTRKPSLFVGRWRFTGMDQWDLDFMDMETPTFIEFDSGGRGEFHFGCVHCSMDHRPAKRDGKAAAEWSFEGHDEGDPVSGRGWAALQEDGTLEGMIVFHEGDESAFHASKSPGGRPKRGKPR
jgi:hypothetical protein